MERNSIGMMSLPEEMMAPSGEGGETRESLAEKGIKVGDTVDIWLTGFAPINGIVLSINETVLVLKSPSDGSETSAPLGMIVTIV